MGVCPKCQGKRLVQNGSAIGHPKKRCKQWAIRTETETKVKMRSMCATVLVRGEATMTARLFLFSGVVVGEAHNPTILKPDFLATTPSHATPDAAPAAPYVPPGE